jgi:hypothetical protein
LFTEECTCFEGLFFARICEVRIAPDAGPVAVEFAPVIVPGLGAVEGLGDVVVALTVAGGVDEFVMSAFGARLGELLDVVDEALPLWEFGVGV